MNALDMYLAAKIGRSANYAFTGSTHKLLIGMADPAIREALFIARATAPVRIGMGVNVPYTGILPDLSGLSTDSFVLQAGVYMPLLLRVDGTEAVLVCADTATTGTLYLTCTSHVGIAVSIDDRGAVV